MGFNFSSESVTKPTKLKMNIMTIKYANISLNAKTNVCGGSSLVSCSAWSSGVQT
jgi:hypothetical protein